jgi:hypothetical protein
MWQKHNNYAPLIANYFWDTFFQNISLPHKKELIFYFFPYLSDDYKEKYYQMIKSLMLTFKDDFPNDLTNILEMKNQEGISYLSFHYLKIY